MTDEEEYVSLLKRNLGDEVNSHFLELQIGRSYRDNPVFASVISQLKQRNFINVNSELDYIIDNAIELEDALRFKGELYATFYFFDEAIETFNELLKIKKDDKQTLFLLNILHYINTGQYNKKNFNRLTVIDSTLAKILKKVITFVSNKLFVSSLDSDVAEEETELIAVYGCRLSKNGQFTSRLIQRLQTALENSNKYPDSDILVCGGATNNSHYEAMHMYNWLIDKGIKPSRIFIDAVGIDAVANSQAVANLIKEKQYKNVRIVTSHQHLARAHISLYFSLIRNELNLPVYSSTSSEAKSDEGEILDNNQALFSYIKAIRSLGIFEKQDFEDYQNSNGIYKWLSIQD